jgi:HlyD family type I secretion membrane fusion protein
MLQKKSTFLYTPVDGIVQNVKTHTIGGVALVGNVLMNIIPEDGDLEVEAMVFDQDIGSIVFGQEVKLKVNSYSFTKYGFLKGTVKYIAADSVQDERLGALFKTIITINKMNERINLSAGMTVTCEVKVKKRRLIDFFISPLLETKDKVLKER